MPDPRGTGTARSLNLRPRAVDLVDVLVYLVVLGLFVQLFPAVISESFALTLLTAVLMKAALEAITWWKKKAIHRLRNADSRAAQAVSVATLLVLLPGSKFLILWLTEAVFGGAVNLGGFFSVTLLILTLMLARAGVRRVQR